MDLLGARTLRWTTQMVSLGWRSLSSEVGLLEGAGVVGGQEGGASTPGTEALPLPSAQRPCACKL